MLFDLALGLPVMDTGRACSELGWSPRHSSLDALRAFLGGLRQGAGAATPPLYTTAGGKLRGAESTTGVGERDRPSPQADDR